MRRRLLRMSPPTTHYWVVQDIMNILEYCKKHNLRPDERIKLTLQADNLSESIYVENIDAKNIDKQEVSCKDYI